MESALWRIAAGAYSDNFFTIESHCRTPYKFLDGVEAFIAHVGRGEVVCLGGCIVWSVSDFSSLSLVYYSVVGR